MAIKAKSFLVETFTHFSQLFRKFVKKTFTGTRAEWDALTTAEKKEYDICNLTDDLAGGELIVSDTVASGDMNPVTSNAVAGVTANKLTVYKGSGTSLADAFDAAGIPKTSNDIYGVCNHVVTDLIKGSGATANTVTLHNYTAGGPAFAIILQKQSTEYGAAFMFYYGQPVMYELRYTNGDYHIQRFG